MGSQYTFHLIANAHLDPVWLWDWREGLNEGIITSRAILDLMDEFPELTCIRGEALIYRHIEENDPETFDRIRRRVVEGRWDVVGGTFVQPDTNLTGTETYCRHLVRSQAYFRSRFGRAAEVAWAADSFGHSAGLPDVLAAAGMTGFASTRPGPAQLALAKPAFWWEGRAGGRVLAYRPPSGWYGSERDETPRRLDALLAAAHTGDLETVGAFYGLGDHGGGPTRRVLADIAAWAADHPEVCVVHSGLHRFFGALRAEVAAEGGDGFLPVHRGEMNYCLRGCYVSVAKLKYAFRKAEAAVSRAETTAAAIAAGLGQPAADLGSAWDALLLNSFHDILPGTAIERAYDDQLDWLGQARHQALTAEHQALNRLALRVDTTRSHPAIGDRPGSVVQLLWNPHPWEYRGPVELEASLDYRPIWAYRGRGAELPVALRGPDGQLHPGQVVETEHTAMPDFPWRKRLVVPVSLPPCGWSVMELAWEEGVARPSRAAAATAAVRLGEHAIGNGIFRVEANPGAPGIDIRRDGSPVFAGAGLGVVTVDDAWGSWGGMADEPASLDLSSVRHHWRVAASEVLEAGPERALLAVRLTGGQSRLDLHLSLAHSRPVVDVAARLFLDERSARVKLVLPAGGDRATFEVLGGQVDRGPAGEVPGGRWVRLHTDRGPVGFASDALYGFDLKDGTLRASVARASRYANDSFTPPDADPWHPVVDCGELRFRFLLTTGTEAERDLPRLARELEMPPVALCVAPKPGDLPRHGSLMALDPAGLQLLALKPAEDGHGWVLRVQETAGRTVEASLTWAGQTIALGTVPSGGIASWRLTPAAGPWRARRVTTQEQ
ncbi:MAG: glycoside hydrolase family 38 [Lentisphaerae bacterium]|nr:glycoside hydrolase family 38 [Lentisphaerota bacterium]